MRTKVGLLLAIVLIPSVPVFAHHSYTMFDRDKVITLQGTVRTWEMGNPHAYLWIYSTNESGEKVLWGLEGPSPLILIRNGWGKNSVKPGDKVTVVVNPLKDGRNGGNLVKMTLEDGRVFYGTRIPGSPSEDSPSEPNGAGK